MIHTDSRLGRSALMVAHCAGMVDMVALPVWVGTLISQYRFDPQQAGSLVTLFLVGAVAASLWFAPRFNRLRGRRLAAIGFGASSAAFLCAAVTRNFGALAALHLIAGFAAGSGLSVTHGTIGRSVNPHRLFAIVGTALGVFAVLFLGVTPQFVIAFGGQALFAVFSAVMAAGAVVSALLFPLPDGESAAAAHSRRLGTPLPHAVWCGISAISCMTVVQATVFSFVERMGADRGFGADRVTGVLIALGLVNMFPPAVAALLERRIDPRKVVLTGPVVQLLLALVITHSTAFVPYAIASSVFVAVILFTHTFAFGLLAQLDPSGRATAATPAMLMVGSAIGPIVGGTIVKGVGYGGLGVAAIAIDVIALLLFSRLLPRTRPKEAIP